MTKHAALTDRINLIVATLASHPNLPEAGRINLNRSLAALLRERRALAA